MSRRQGTLQDLDFSDWEPRDCSTIPGLTGSSLLPAELSPLPENHG